MKKTFYRLLPYLMALLVGILFLLIGIGLRDEFGTLKSFFIGISTAFFAIPVIYIFYQRVFAYSQRRLNKEMFDYAKMQVDRVILTLIKKLQEIVYPLEEMDPSPTGVGKFLSLKNKQIITFLSKSEYLGFQVFQRWEDYDENLENALKSTFILQNLDDEQVTSLISILSNLRYLEMLRKSLQLYEMTKTKIVSVRIVAGKEFNNKDNLDYPDRYLLLGELGNNKAVVLLYGDFQPNDIDKLLIMFRINEEYREFFGNAIFELLSEVSNWVSLTGSEFIIDPKIFRIGRSGRMDVRLPGDHEL